MRKMAGHLNAGSFGQYSGHLILVPGNAIQKAVIDPKQGNLNVTDEKFLECKNYLLVAREAIQI